MVDLFNLINYLLEGTDYLQEGEFISRIILDIDGFATYHTNFNRIITSAEIENL